MGLRSELRRGMTALATAGRVAVRSQVRAIEDWIEHREYMEKARELDRQIEKAARRAQDAGLDGTHEDPGFEDDEDRGDGLDGDPAQKPQGPRGKQPQPDNGGGMDDNSWSGAPMPEPHNPTREPKSIRFDPFDLVALTGWRERPSNLSYLAMERMATTVPVITDIIRTRCAQVERFCQRPDDRHSPGLKVRLRDRNASPTPESDAICRELEDAILNCGFTPPENPQDGVPLKTFARMFVRDSLTLDQATFEIIPDRKGRPSHFVIVDPTTIRLLDPVYQEKEGIKAVQIIQDIVVADFTADELAFCIRNPRSGIHTYGYGESELETLIREITGFLWGIEYNRRFFSQGSTTKGILNFKGAMPEKQMQAFRRQWYALVSGVTNAWRTPIVNAEELQWINLQASNRDMEYSAWIDFLIKVCCARYLIAPEEVNFSYGNTNQSQAMGNTSTEEKLKASKDLGLRPLVQWFFECLNRHFVQRIHPDFEVVPVGLDEKGVEAETELLSKQTAVWMTVDEARKAVGEEPLPDGMGECILNPTWLQWAQGKQMEAQGGMPGAPGMPGEDGGDNPFDGFGGDEDGEAEDGDPTGGIGVVGRDGKPFAYDEDDEDDPAVAKSVGPAIGSRPSRVVRYEIPVVPARHPGG